MLKARRRESFELIRQTQHNVNQLNRTDDILLCTVYPTDPFGFHYTRRVYDFRR